MSVENAPYIQGNLHYKPPSAHLTKSLQTGVAHFARWAYTKGWTLRQVHYFSLVFIIPAHILLINLVALEVVFGIAAASFTVVLNRVRYQLKNDSLEKHTLQFLSFSLHAIVNLGGIIAYNVICGGRANYLCNSLLDHFLHWISAAAVHYAIGPYFDQMHERSRQLPMHRILNLFKDIPNLKRELIFNARRDRMPAFEVAVRLIEQWNTDDYFARHPGALTFILELNLKRLLQDPHYYHEAAEHMGDFMDELTILSEQFGGFIPGLYGEEPVSEETRVYQEFLAELTKQACREICDRLNDSGRERLKSGMAFLQLWNYIIYKEVMTETRNQCPNKTRENALQNIRKLIGNLKEDQHAALERRLLLEEESEDTAVNAADTAVNAAFNAIYGLSMGLFQFMKNGNRNLFHEAFWEVFPPPPPPLSKNCISASSP